MKRFNYVLFASMLVVPLASCGLGLGSERSLDRSSESEDCVFTQGYWKNHADAWPVDTLTLGTVSYTKDQMLSIFHTPVAGNGLIQLAHQLIAAKLNVEKSGATAIAGAIDEADKLIGDLVVPPVGDGHLAPQDTSTLTGELDTFNNEGECAARAVCGDGHMNAGETCDDGNTIAGDGCSATCQSETACGNGKMEGAETCDDGNKTDGDGCSATCKAEAVCGNGKMEGAETCDDGNTKDGDGCSATCVCEQP